MYACTEGNEVLVVIVWTKEGRKLEFLHLLYIFYQSVIYPVMLNEEELSEPTFFDSLTVSMTIDSMGLHLQCNIIQKIC